MSRYDRASERANEGDKDKDKNKDRDTGERFAAPANLG